VLLTSSYAFAHRVRTENNAPQVCFCHSPLRFAWTMTDRYRSAWAPTPTAGLAFGLMAAAMRRSDRASARHVDLYLTQAEYTADQIRRFYGREAEIIGAPVDCDLFHPSGEPAEDYFLLCGRLTEPYLGAEPVLEAFRDLDERLVIVGTGPAEAHLRSIAPSNVDFRGRVDDDELVRLLQHCKALISPTRHDFGLLPIEAMATGRPVLALGEGGALATVVPGVSGEFYRDGSAAGIAAALRAFDPEAFDVTKIREHALRWDRRGFRRRLVEAVERVAGSAGGEG
jgi:glycosyltransferase involved in cell wall biosynthesis